MIVGMAEIKLAIHNVLYADTQINQAYSGKGMMARADDHYPLLASCSQDLAGDEQVACDHEGRGAAFYGGHLSILAVSNHQQAAWLDIIKHRCGLHGSHKDEIAELAAPL